MIWRQHQQWYIFTILHRITHHTQATKVNIIIIINIDDTILQLLLIPPRPPLVPLPDLFCLLLCNICGETKLTRRKLTSCIRIACHLFLSLVSPQRLQRRRQKISGRGTRGRRWGRSRSWRILSSILMMMMILTLVAWVWWVIRCRMATMCLQVGFREVG